MLWQKLAIDTLPGTEVDSAYSASLAYNSEITAAHDQEERSWQVTAHIERYPDGHVSVKLQARDGNGAPITGMVFSALLKRPTDKRADRFIALIDNGNGVYRGDAYDVMPGQWDMVLVAERNAHRLFRSEKSHGVAMTDVSKHEHTFDG